MRRKVFIAAIVACLSTLSLSQAPGQDDTGFQQMGARPGAESNLPSQASASFGGSLGGGGGGGGVMPYSFSYSVNDRATGNVHSRQESGDSNGVVTGQYQLIEPNGALRIVEYTADSRGFRPTIRRIPNYAPPPPQPPRRVRSLFHNLSYKTVY